MLDASRAVVTDVIGPEAVVVRVQGDIGHEAAPELAAALTAAEEVEAARTVVDLRATAFADSSILHVLLEAQRRHRARQRRMVLAGPFSGSLARLFEVTGTAGFFVIACSMSAALDA
ncbi:STAS domain-containing protein [Streptomyces polygonati]|uniref:STAS domain-containing protein n=1 Tax=Streptomyces polygonati TaxID=1617087 RepID=A0ABV8HLG2_9ACTN